MKPQGQLTPGEPRRLRPEPAQGHQHQDIAREAGHAHGATVIKIGGSTLGEHDTTLEDVVALQREQVPTVIVHGGGKVITQWMERQGARPTFVRGLRVTDQTSLEIVVAVLAGLVNKQLVASIHGLGGRAVGVCGADGGMLQGVIKDADLGFVGQVVAVDPGPISALLGAGFIPVVAPVAVHRVDGSTLSGSLLNMNADTVAGEIAVALKARQLVFLTDVEGVLTGGRRVIPRLTARQAQGMVQSGVAGGGMIPKLEACVAALESVSAAYIVDGRSPGALRAALRGEPVGTRVG